MAENDHEKTRTSGSGVDASLARHGGLSYLAIPAVNKRQSAVFYEKVLGWNVEERATDDFRFTDGTGHLIGQWEIDGVISRDPGLLPYFYVDHIDNAVALVAAHGGEVVKAPYREGDLWIA